MKTNRFFAQMSLSIGRLTDGKEGRTDGFVARCACTP